MGLHGGDGLERIEDSALESLFKDVGDGQGSEIRARFGEQRLSWLDGWNGYNDPAFKPREKSIVENKRLVDFSSSTPLVITLVLTQFVLACSRPEGLMEA